MYFIVQLPFDQKQDTGMGLLTGAFGQTCAELVRQRRVDKDDVILRFQHPALCFPGAFYNGDRPELRAGKERGRDRIEFFRR